MIMLAPKNPIEDKFNVVMLLHIFHEICIESKTTITIYVIRLIKVLITKYMISTTLKYFLSLDSVIVCPLKKSKYVVHILIKIAITQDNCVQLRIKYLLKTSPL